MGDAPDASAALLRRIVADAPTDRRGRSGPREFTAKARVARWVALRHTTFVRAMTWNVNSIRARNDHFVAWLDVHEPDIVALQETKCTDEVFTDLADAYTERGYQWCHFGLDHHNGVAILSRVGLSRVKRGFSGANRAPFDEARLLSARCGDDHVMSVYVPNGREIGDPHYLFKLVWLERLRAEIRETSPTIVLGDFNVAPTDLDVYDPKRWRDRNLVSTPERAGVAAIIEEGYVDVTRSFHPGPGVFTWYSYRPGQFEKNQGLRLDLVLVSSDRARSVTNVWIDHAERANERPSDHAPIVIEW